MLLFFLLSLALCGPSFQSALLDSTKLMQAKVQNHNGSSDQSHSSKPDDDSNSAGSKIVYKVKKGSCKCIDVEKSPCDVEMTEESVIKAKGASCRKGERFCCTREKHLVNLFKPNSPPSDGKPLISSQILRDEISNYAKVTVASDGQVDPSKAEEGIDKGPDGQSQQHSDPIVRPSVLRAILSFVTEGIKFLTNVFSR